MHAALRPFVTAGVALVGASAIAVTPIAPTPHEVHIASSAVELTAAPQPLEFYRQVTREALTNAAKVVGPYLRLPLALIDFLTEPVYVVRVVVSNLFNPALVSYGVQTVISPVLSGIGATAVALKDVAGAASNRDLMDLVHAVVDIPARIADGVLNGGYPLSGGQGTLRSGILTPFPGPYSDVSGPLAYPQFFLFYSFTNGPYRPFTETRFGVHRTTVSADESSTTTPVHEVPRLDTATVTLDATAPALSDTTPPAQSLVKAESSAAQKDGHTPQAEPAQPTAEASDTTAAETTPTDTETAKPALGLRAHQAKHPLLDKIRQRVAERRAHAADRSANATRQVRAKRSDN